MGRIRHNSLHGESLIDDANVVERSLEHRKVRHPYLRQHDAAVSLAAIEHLEDVHAFVGQLRKLCILCGLIIIMTLNDRSILYDLARRLFKLGWQGPLVRLYDKHHINHFSVHSLECLVANAGLAIARRVLHNAPL